MSEAASGPINVIPPAAGIISCMACNPERSAMLAAGSYLGDTGIFEENSGDLLYVLQGQRGGITQVWSHQLQQLY